MRFFVVFALFLALTQASRVALQQDARSARVFEDQIKKVVSCLQENLNKGIPEVGLPSFDPLKVEADTIDFDRLNSDLISGKVSVNNLVVSGLAHWNFEKLTGSVTIIPPGYKIGYNLVNPEVAIDSDYDMDFTILGKRIFGKGHVSAKVVQESEGGNMKLTLTNGLTLKDFDIAISVDEASLKITGLMGDEELSEKISEDVSANLPAILKEHQKQISDIIKKILMDAINKKTRGIGDLNLLDILKELKQRCLSL